MPTKMPPRADSAARDRHQTLDLIGLRAHATTVGLIQLCEELLNSDVLGVEGLDRIKDAIFTELTVGKRERVRSEEHTSELQSLMRISYAVFCWYKKIHLQIL